MRTFTKHVSKDINVDRYDDVDLYWMKESTLNYIDIFYNNNNKIMMQTEQELLEEVYGFDDYDSLKR